MRGSAIWSPLAMLLLVALAPLARAQLTPMTLQSAFTNNTVTTINGAVQSNFLNWPIITLRSQKGAGLISTLTSGGSGQFGFGFAVSQDGTNFSNTNLLWFITGTTNGLNGGPNRAYTNFLADALGNVPYMRCVYATNGSAVATFVTNLYVTVGN